MKVAELIEMLKQCDQDATVITWSFGYETEPNCVYEDEVGGIDHRHSWDKIKCVRIVDATPGHLESQGYKVVAQKDKS